MIKLTTNLISRYNVELKLAHPFFIGFLSSFFCVLIFAITAIRAASTGITWDEAWTYFLYAFPHNIWDKELFLAAQNAHSANNHLLNTFLIRFFTNITGLHFNELVIRLPNIIAFGLYLWIAHRMLIQNKIDVLTFAVLVFNYELNEFFGLARGYGIGTFLVMAATFFYMKWKDFNYPHTYHLYLCGYLLILAAIANTTIMLLFPPIFIVALMHLWPRNKKFYQSLCFLVNFIIMLFLTIQLILYHFRIVQMDEYLLTATEQSFFYAIPGAYLNMLLPIDSYTSCFVLIFTGFLVASLLAVVYRRNLYHTDFFIIFCFLMLTFFLSEFIFHKGYPIRRTLIPFYPIFIFGLRDVFSKGIGPLKFPLKYKTYLCVFPAIFLFFICLARTDLKKTSEWTNDYVVKEQIDTMGNIYFFKNNNTPVLIHNNAPYTFYYLKIQKIYE